MPITHSGKAITRGVTPLGEARQRGRPRRAPDRGARAQGNPGGRRPEGLALGAPQGAREPPRRGARPALCRRRAQRSRLPRLPAEGGAARPLPLWPTLGARAPALLALLGEPLEPRSLREARPHPPSV